MVGSLAAVLLGSTLGAVHAGSVTPDVGASDALVLVGAAEPDAPVEDYASYQPQKTCAKRAKPGTRVLARWINNTFDGGSARATVRACDSGGVSEHKDGRAIDWSMDATRKADRQEVRRFLDALFAADADGTPHAKARRMGVMYVIWNDRSWASYRAFEPQAYVSSSCKPKKLAKCPATLRHRDHVHISLSRPGGRGETSWYVGKL